MKTQNFKISGAWLAAIIIPLLWLFLFTPYGMDTTDFGYFYGYGWRILNGQVPYRDFAYIKPAFPLYWHAFWLALSPEKYAILTGKAGFLASVLAASWFCALYLRREFNFSKLNLPLPLLATCGFVYGIHSFPHMPWHTADGILFSTLSLWLSSFAPFFSGIAAACAMACKQSFLPVPVIICALLWIKGSKRACLNFTTGLILILGLFILWLVAHDAFGQFRTMTTGQLDIREALDAGLLIYLRQNWWLPALACLPLALAFFLHKKLPYYLLPTIIYMVILTIYTIWQIETQQRWLGYGYSWPTLFLVLGAICLLFPQKYLISYYKQVDAGKKRLAASIALSASLVTAWCVAISGGYKIPALLAVPGLFSFFLVHKYLGGNVRNCAWLSLVCGMCIFVSAYQYPYVFPERPLSRADMIYDAGQIYPQASGVKIDQDMLERLRELKILRQKYGPNYKTLPAFTLSYYLNGDYPVFGSDWLIDWEINGESDKFYKELGDKNLVIFMERDQMNAQKADGYDRAGYTVPQLVRNNWKIIEETPHFVVFKRPEETN